MRSSYSYSAHRLDEEGHVSGVARGRHHRPRAAASRVWPLWHPSYRLQFVTTLELELRVRRVHSMIKKKTCGPLGHGNPPFPHHFHFRSISATAFRILSTSIASARALRILTCGRYRAESNLQLGFAMIQTEPGAWRCRCYLRPCRGRRSRRLPNDAGTESSTLSSHMHCWHQAAAELASF